MSELAKWILYYASLVGIYQMIYEIWCEIEMSIKGKIVTKKSHTIIAWILAFVIEVALAVLACR